MISLWTTSWTEKLKKPTFNDWGECATRIVSIYRYISKLQEHYQFHLAISGHEGINKDKDDEGSTINPTITIEAQDQIKKRSSVNLMC